MEKPQINLVVIGKDKRLTDKWMNRQMDGWMDEWMNGWIDRWMDG